VSDGPDTGARNSKSIVTSGDERSVPCVPLGRGGNRCFATSPVLAVGVAQPTPIARDGGGATVTACVSNSDRRTGNADRISVVSDLPCDSLSSPATIRYTAVCIRFRYSCWVSYANGQTPVTESLPLRAIGKTCLIFYPSIENTVIKKKLLGIFAVSVYVAWLDRAVPRPGLG